MKKLSYIEAGELEDYRELITSTNYYWLFTEIGKEFDMKLGSGNDSINLLEEVLEDNGYIHVGNDWDAESFKQKNIEGGTDIVGESIAQDFADTIKENYKVPSMDLDNDLINLVEG